MDDKELLAIARKYESLLVRIESGEIQNGLEDAIDCVSADNPTSFLVAGIIAGIKQFIFRNNIMPDLLKIRKMKGEKEYKRALEITKDYDMSNPSDCCLPREETRIEQHPALNGFK